jgi:hypothetical protein
MCLLARSRKPVGHACLTIQKNYAETKHKYDVQYEYIAAHQEAMQEFDRELRRLWECITAPHTATPLVLTVMLAKEYTEWGRLVNAVAEAAYTKRWSIPTLSGALQAILWVAFFFFFFPLLSLF